ncbi:MAG: molybdopterin-guanine dinucleotide biosynthesis protein B [Methylococcales bacterium]|nr:molybdopterin-guanine dinucleotide biosynthesis protein B [Methylococcales bacterium]
MSSFQPPVLGFAAYSGTGKTTLLTRLLPVLNSLGLKIGVIKFSHHDVQIDQPGKDSYRLRAAGATPVMLVSPYRRAVICEFASPQPLVLEEQLAAFPAAGLDLILVEGFRDTAYAKIELHRPSLGKPLLYPHDPHIIAVACDQPITVPAGLRRLDLNDTDGIAQFIAGEFLGILQ